MGWMQTTSFISVFKLLFLGKFLKPYLERLFLEHVQWARNSDPLDDLMNGQMKTKLNIPTNVTWGGM